MSNIKYWSCNGDSWREYVLKGRVTGLFLQERWWPNDGEEDVKEGNYENDKSSVIYINKCYVKDSKVECSAGVLFSSLLLQWNQSRRQFCKLNQT